MFLVTFEVPGPLLGPWQPAAVVLDGGSAWTRKTASTALCRDDLQHLQPECGSTEAANCCGPGADSLAGDK